MKSNLLALPCPCFSPIVALGYHVALDLFPFPLGS